MLEKKVLYLGTDPNHYATSAEVMHCPIIKMVPRDFTSFAIQHQLQDVSQYTHVVVTSKNAVQILMDALYFYSISLASLQEKIWVCIGSSTEQTLRDFGITESIVAGEETQDGVIKVLDVLDLNRAYLFYPRSAQARPTLACYLKVRQLRHQICDLYDTVTCRPAIAPILSNFNEVVFTSPSTVNAFFELFSVVPPHLILTPIGPITKQALERKMK